MRFAHSTPDAAFEACTRQAIEHYENFPVGSLLVPAENRRHIHAVYAFARTADDFADETVQTFTIEQRLALLDRWEDQLVQCLQGRYSGPVFEALACAIHECSLPPQLLHDLLSAFKQDVVKTRYNDFPEVLDYCRRSANPVGRLVLHIFDERDERLHLLSDQICTGLQLANFWQDIAVDVEKDRIYLPLDELARHGLSDHDVLDRSSSVAMRDLIQFQVERTWEIFRAGRPLPLLLDGGLQLEIKATWLGGTTILKKIEQGGYLTTLFRPKLSKLDFGAILARALLEEW